MFATSIVEYTTFVVAAMICLMGAIGVVALRNPVHNALSLIATLFGVAVLFVAQGAYFLAAIQIIVYAGAIVILFLFVIMLLGVDKAEDLRIEPIAGQRPVALVVAAGTLALLLTTILTVGHDYTGGESLLGPLGALPEVAGEVSDVRVLGNWLFTDYVFAFEITAVLLTIAVVGAVVLARRPSGPLDPLPEDDALEVAP